jgi:signal transduction histidine kinase
VRVPRVSVRGIRARLALALLVVVAGALGVVYLIVVPSLEAELVNAKLDQLENDLATVVNEYRNSALSDQEFAEQAAAGVQARVVVFLDLEGQLIVFGDSNTTSSLDIGGDRVALRALRTRELVRGTVERNGRDFAQVAVPVQNAGTVVMVADSLADPLSSLRLIKRRLLFAGALALLFAVVVGYAAASLHARRIRRLERAAERIADGRLDEPVRDRGNDELGDLAGAFERMRVRLERLDRARSEFIANASHELRTPLFSLGGFLELMADEEVDEPTRQEFLETMREQVERLAKLATDLLDLSRLDAGRMHVEHEPVDLGETARAVVDEFRALAERRGHVLEVAVEGRPVARADGLRALQIARALVDNALTHTPEGTRVLVRARSDREHTYLEVEDDGPGIPAEHAPHVFDRFYRGDGRVASGSGLGLAIARELAQTMAGRVVLVSEPGRTLVRVALGAAPTSVPAGEHAASVST